MREERIAARYGRALFMCSEDETTLVQIEKELSLLSQIMNAPNSELRTLLLNPAFNALERARVVNELATSFNLQPLTRNLLLLLIEKGRAQFLQSITKAFSS